MKKQIIIGLLFLITAVNLQASPQQEVPYTLEDRDRLIRVEAKMGALEAKMGALGAKMGALEVKMEALETKMDVKFEAVHSRIDYLFWIVGFVAALIIFNLGYIIWDRRTALRPALDKASSADDKTKNLINALREYAKKNPELADILRTHGLF